MLSSHTLRFFTPLLLLAELAFALASFGCKCRPYLPPGQPIRVELLGPFTNGGSYFYGQQLDDGGVAPSCADADGLSTATTTIVPGNHYGWGGEVCVQSAPITVDAPVPVMGEPDGGASLRSPFMTRRPLFEGSTETMLAGCPGIWSYGLVPNMEYGDADAGIAANDDPFRDPIPGRNPPWVVMRVFEASAPCPAIAGLDVAGARCGDTYAARLRRATAP